MGALIRSVSAAGGFASVLQKGEQDAGTILVVLIERGTNARVYDRMPQADGSRAWILAQREDPNDKSNLQEWLDRRAAQDRDLWIVELDIPNGERFIGLA